MSKLNQTLPPIELASKRASIVPVLPALRMAVRQGFDPYNNYAQVASKWQRYARMCGAVPTVSAFLARQAD